MSYQQFRRKSDRQRQRAGCQRWRKHADERAVQRDQITGPRRVVRGLRRRGLELPQHQREIARMRVRRTLAVDIGHSDQRIAAESLSRESAVAVDKFLQHVVRRAFIKLPLPLQPVRIPRQQLARRREFGIDPGFVPQERIAHLREMVEQFEPHDQHRAHDDEYGECRAAAVQRALLAAPRTGRIEPRAGRPGVAREARSEFARHRCVGCYASASGKSFSGRSLT
ncbi:hypothetical protein [Burkholderia dolosa]|uniref:hypothetical protein n=1 Tax=Burkholderia dolosa TaxID=152500 RepID=UPI0031FD2A5A